jgi:hypothetical protein
MELLSTDKEMTLARNATKAHAQDLVATTHPASNRTVHSLTTLYSKRLMFAVCV